MYGKEIKEWREIKNKTQQEVANETGIPQRTISYIESDAGIPNIEQCVKLAKYYGISIEELIGKNENKEYEKTKYNNCNIFANGNNNLWKNS